MEQGEGPFVMWQSNQAKAVLKARERERQKRQAFGARSIKRVDIELLTLKRGTSIETGRLHGKLVLNEISPAGTEILTPVKLLHDTDLQIRLEHPTAFSIRGRVVRVQEIPFATARVMSDRRMMFRTTVLFLVNDEEEKMKLEAWISEVRANYLGGLAISLLPGEPRLAPIEATTPQAALSEARRDEMKTESSEAAIAAAEAAAAPGTEETPAEPSAASTEETEKKAA
jgi:hypothetical protein